MGGNFISSLLLYVSLRIHLSSIFSLRLLTQPQALCGAPQLQNTIRTMADEQMNATLFTTYLQLSHHNLANVNVNVPRIRRDTTPYSSNHATGMDIKSNII